MRLLSGDQWRDLLSKQILLHGGAHVKGAYIFPNFGQSFPEMYGDSSAHAQFSWKTMLWLLAENIDISSGNR